MHLWDMRKPFQAACTRAGIEGLRIHDLRHMGNQLIANAGANLRELMVRMGHDGEASGHAAGRKSPCGWQGW